VKDLTMAAWTSQYELDLSRGSQDTSRHDGDTRITAHRILCARGAGSVAGAINAVVAAKPDYGGGGALSHVLHAI
jgi:hypothetical protein